MRTAASRASPHSASTTSAKPSVQRRGTQSVVMVPYAIWMRIFPKKQTTPTCRSRSLMKTSASAYVRCPSTTSSLCAEITIGSRNWARCAMRALRMDLQFAHPVQHVNFVIGAWKPTVQMAKTMTTIRIPIAMTTTAGIPPPVCRNSNAQNMRASPIGTYCAAAMGRTTTKTA